MMDARVDVDLGDRSYPIHIGAGVLARAREWLPADETGRCFAITHPIIARLHGEALERGMAGRPPEVILVPSGERQKSVRRASALWDELLERGADRRSTIIAFGGGVIGDLAGFVAATYMRGVPYVQIPTTLLAQVDSSVGGKVAVNRPGGKNLVGAFYQPRLVIADVGVLATLRARDYREGLAEVVKHAVIADPQLFEWLETHHGEILKREAGILTELVRCNCEIKAGVVRADEREAGFRAILNFGHTAGHAIESVMKYGALRHGEAVSIGMVVASRIGRIRGLTDDRLEGALVDLLAKFGLPTQVPNVSASTILGRMSSDKKSLGGVPRFVLPRALGKMELGCEVPADIVEKALVECGASR